MAAIKQNKSWLLTILRFQKHLVIQYAFIFFVFASQYDTFWILVNMSSAKYALNLLY